MATTRSCYTCNYLDPCCKRCCNIRPMINSGLVRSNEAIGRQNFCCNLNTLEKRVNRLETRLQNTLDLNLTPIKNKCPCLVPANTAVLTKSKAAFDYSNLCNRVTVMYKKINRMANITGSTQQINRINIKFRCPFPDLANQGSCATSICTKVNILTKRINAMNTIINNLAL